MGISTKDFPTEIHFATGARARQGTVLMYLLGCIHAACGFPMFSIVMEWCWFHCVFLVCLELNYEIPFADNLLNKQNCNNRFRCHPGSLRMFATTRKQTNWSSFSKFPLNPLFPMTSNFLPWGNIWRALDSSSEETTTIANINWTAALIMLLLT